MIQRLLDLLERFVVAHETMAKSLSTIGNSNRPIHLYDQGKEERKY